MNADGILQRIPGLWSSVGTRQCPVPTGIYRSGMYFINVESAVSAFICVHLLIFAV
jgi:hypothetical protein